MAVNEKTKRHVTLILPTTLHERLNEMRWETRAPSFTGLLRHLLQEGVDRHDNEREHEAETQMARAGT